MLSASCLRIAIAMFLVLIKLSVTVLFSEVQYVCSVLRRLIVFCFLFLSVYVYVCRLHVCFCLSVVNKDL